MKVLVIGATGATGREVLKAAAARGHDVTALARNPSALPGARVVQADVTQPETLDAAMAGQDAVINAIGEGQGAPANIRTVAARSIVESMMRHHVRRLVTMSSFGAGDSRGQGGLLFSKVVAPLFMKHILADQTASEAIVQAAPGLQWVIVRPARLTSGPRTQGPRVVFAGGNAFWKVSRADVAAFMVARLDDDAYLGKTPGLTT
jgi:putative NADH-flavin reductase